MCQQWKSSIVSLVCKGSGTVKSYNEKTSHFLPHKLGGKIVFRLTGTFEMFLET